MKQKETIVKKYDKKVLALQVLLIGVFSLVLLQCAGAEDEQPLKNAIIWRITGNELQKPSYLYGTIHSIDSSDFFLHKTVAEQLRRSDILVLETDLTIPDYQQRAFQYALMEDDSLDRLLSADQFARVKDFFLKEFSFPIEAVKRMKPFYLASLLSALKPSEKKVSYEEVFIAIAREEEKAIGGISTLEKEAEMLSLVDMDEQVEYLLREIAAYKNGNADAIREKMVRAYTEADLEEINALMVNSLEDFQSIYARMFTERNRQWVPRMEDMMLDQSCFFAVGVGHLPGEDGLIRLLRNQGYKVVPVHMDFWFHD